RTSGAQMNDAFKAVGIGASAAGADLVEQMAVLGTLSQTMEGGEAGGLYKAFFENVSAAQDKLGMKFTDAGGRGANAHGLECVVNLRAGRAAQLDGAGGLPGQLLD
ncbi:phage tail tape measure protein, partial [Pseudomonas aeruginosa]